ncbi:MAG TPA: ATP-binding protein [Aquihabitans sp.]|nr:ATP-binding protein [Aquihabitans sp.]
MEVSPFPYQGPLEPHQVRGRLDLVADLTERVTEHRVTALLGPRRYGKTSVLRRVAADVIAGGAAVVWVDLYEVASMADLAARLDDALARVTGTFAARAAQIAAAASLNLGLVRIELRAPTKERADPLLTTHALLEVLTRTVAETPTIVIVDEFAGIARVDGAAGLLRTHLQHHYQEMGLVFAGSEPSMMRTLFTEQAEPFYAQADLVEIGPLSTAEVVDLVATGFEDTGRGAGPLPQRIAAFVDGHPQRAMQAADAAWRLVAPGEDADLTTWEQALAGVRAATADGNERLYSGLQEGERVVLRVLASGGSVFGTAAEVLGLAGGTAQNARRRLVDRGHLLRVDDAYRLVDPVFADWIQRRFPI